MENKKKLIEYVQEIYGTITQMLMFKDQSLDNPLYKFLVKNIVSCNEKYDKEDFSILRENKFISELIDKISNLKLASEVYLNNNNAKDLFENSILELTKIHQKWIIIKTEL